MATAKSFIRGRIRGYFLCAVVHFLRKFGAFMAKVAVAAVGGIRFQCMRGVKGIGVVRGGNGRFDSGKYV